MVAPHDDAVANCRPAPDDAAHADHASFDVSVGNDAAVGNDRLPQSGAVDFAPRQKAWVRIDGRGSFEKAVLRLEIGQVEVRLVKGADRSDVFPIALKNVGIDVSL